MAAKGYSKGKAPPLPPVGKGKTKRASENRLLKVVLQQAFSGAEVQLTAWSETSIKSLKDQISRTLHVPILCQKLMVETSETPCHVQSFLSDRDRLHKYVNGEADSVRLVLIISDEDACRTLGDVDESPLEDRMLALGALAQLASQSSERALKAIVNCLEDNERLIRLEAARSLSQLAKQGNHQAIAALGFCVGFDFQDDLNAATAATEALAFLASQSNESAWATIHGLLESDDPILKKEAIKVMAIASFFYKSSSALSAFTPFLEKSPPFVKGAAVASIAFAASSGDSQAVDLLCSCLEDSCLEIQRSAIAGLGVVATTADDKVISLLLKLLQEQIDETIKDVTLAALAKVAGQGARPDVVDVVCSLVEDPHGSESALISLAKIADKGCNRAVTAIFSRAEDADWNVRGAAIAAATKLAYCTDVRLLNLLRQGAGDFHADVRIVSLTGLGYCAYQGHEESFAALKAQLDVEVDARARGAAAKLVHCMERMRSGDPVSRRVCRTLMDQIWSQWGLGSLVFTPREH